MPEVDTIQPRDVNENQLRGRRFKYLTTNSTTTLQATGIDVVISKIVITDDDDNATWELQNGAGVKLFDGVCDRVGSWEYDISENSDGTPVNGLKIVIANVTGTLKLQVLWQ